MGWWRRYLQWRLRNVRRLATTDSGFAVVGGAAIAAFRWEEVTRITAFKRDLLTVDLLCMIVESAHGAVEVDEAMIGYTDFEDRMSGRFGLVPDWKLTVLFPAFMTNATPLYERAEACSSASA